MADNDNLTPETNDDQQDESTLPVDGRVVDIEIETELQDSYLTYAMSTIMDRALPDVRDGLKPSQRRILVAMNDLNLRPNRKHIKCAKICGDTSGNYHPHGESVIYPTMVNMAQTWRARVPIVDPQGNFGSIDGDPPAAMRYTEARLTHAALDMLSDLKLGTVDFQPNYDDRLMEPTVLPGKFPQLLVNGSVGIAVGMATSLAPHNPTEVFDSIVRVIEDPDITPDQLMQDVLDDDGVIKFHGIKGPDFPTGGVIAGRRGIVDAYLSGRGKVTMRGECHVEQQANGREQIVIDAIPYMLNQSTLVEKIVEAVKEERIKDISDVRNESGREAQSRIVIELKKGADATVVENQLYQFTPLQQTFSIHNIALVNRRPRTLSLREMIDCYIGHRVDVIRRRTAYLLQEAKRKAHVLEGLIYAVVDIDEVIKLIRSSRTREEAIGKLMARRFRIQSSHPAASTIPQRLIDHVAKFENDGGVPLTRVQAEQIGSMRLIQLVGLEVERLVNEYREIVAQIEEYESILADHKRVLALIVDDCVEMRGRYNSPRVTRIEDAAGDIDIEALIQEGDVTVTISHQGYAKRVPLDTYRTQGRGGKGIIASDSKDEDFIEHVFVASTHDSLLCFTDTGRVFKMKVYELPEMSRTSKGRPIVNLIELRAGEKVRAFLAIRDFESGSNFLTFVSRSGIVKRTALKEYRNVNRSGLIAVGVKDDDAILDVVLTTGVDDLMLISAKGMAIRFSEQDVRLMGRPAAGVKGMDLGNDDEIVGVVVVPMVPDDDCDMMTSQSEIDAGLSLLTITENGYGKRTPVDEYRVQPESGKPRSQSRGGKGRADIKSSARNGRSAAALGVHDTDDVVVITRGGQLVRMAASTISQIGRGTQGVRVVSMKKGDDSVIAAARVREDADEESDANAESNTSDE
ncbi:MAG: DNA gyrase subunit A [Phycisphaeraceae bacterium]|nr:DNA gyrase subunit A [Phycisphaerales bacterium]MCB9861120.1 DNA gyrase subunit A [Phycisphaeraceae bacterium]